MTMMFPYEVVLHLPGQDTGEKDRYNRPIIGPDQDLPSPAWWEPRVTSEDVQAAEQYVTGYTLFLPLDHPGAPLPGLAKVTLPLQGGPARFEVVGEAGQQPPGLIVEGYVRVALQKVSG